MESVVEILLGEGKYSLQTYSRQNGTHGIMLKDTKKPHKIASFIDEGVVAGYVPNENDILISCKNIESARVLQDQVNKLVLEMMGLRCERF